MGCIVFGFVSPDLVLNPKSRNPKPLNPKPLKTVLDLLSRPMQLGVAGAPLGFVCIQAERLPGDCWHMGSSLKYGSP